MARKKPAFYRHVQLRKWVDMGSLQPEDVATLDHEKVRAAGTRYRWTWSKFPEKDAVKGRWVKLKNRETGKLVDGWLIVHVGDRVPAAQAEAQERDWMDQRRHSDV